MIRKALKKETAKGTKMPDDFAVLKGLKQAIEIHCLINCGSWTQAAVELMSLSTVKLEQATEGLFNAMPLSWKTRILEFAAVIILMLKFR
mmetsp:Transcript_46913/g.62083  ORF Transcript_46913/g.62083 Transcript_46913/m.62083 type:complete len:90 (+) Transcript_46913:1379-1648(+)